MIRSSRAAASVWLALVTLSLVSASALGAQSSATLDLSSSRLRYSGDSATSAAFTVAPALRFLATDASLDLVGGLSQFAGGGWSTQGLLGGSAFTPWPFVVGELSGTTGGSVHADGTRTAQSLATARLHLVRPVIGGWLGGSAGETWDTLGWHRIVGTEVGAWVRREGLTATLSLAPTRIADSIGYADAQLTVRALIDRADLTATVGRRGGDAGALGGGTQGWANVSAALWVGRTVAITASGGRFPSDPMEGYRPAVYGEIGLRFGIRDLSGLAASTSTPDRAPAPSRARPAMTRIDRVEDEAAHTVHTFEVLSDGGDQRIIRLDAPAAERVEIIGDFTGWQPVSLVRASGRGWWTTTLSIGAGIHQMNLRVDGGQWLAPPGLPALLDEDGGVVGILTVTNR